MDLREADELGAADLHDGVARVVFVGLEGKLLKELGKDDCLVEKGLHVASHEGEGLGDLFELGADVKNVLGRRKREKRWQGRKPNTFKSHFRRATCVRADQCGSKQLVFNVMQAN